MKNMYLKKFMLPGLMMAALGFSSLDMGAQTTITYSFTGAMQTFTVPNCVATVTIECAGASGVGMNGFLPGQGGKAYGILSVTAGQVLNIFAGGSNGYNGGGIGLGGANGGGGSDVRLGGVAFTDRVIVAGGGGGAGGDSWQCLTPSATGHGGGGTAIGVDFVGGAGGAGYTSGTGCGTNGGNTGGTGGTGYHGGGGGGGGFTSGGAGANANGSAAGTGMLGSGGNSFNSPSCGATGGGGGGYYGGGGAAGTNCGAGRGGGGSSWTGPCTSPSFTAGTNTGNGYVTITYDFGVPSLTITSTAPNLQCLGTTQTLTASGAATFTWSNGTQGNTTVVTPTANTTYSVAAQGTAACPAYGLFTTTMIALPVVTSTASPNYIICPGTPVTLSGIGADSYFWTGGVTNGTPFNATSTTIYTVTGTNLTTGCSNTNTILVPVYVASVSVSAPTTICAGSSANLSASGAISYTWNTGSQFPQVSVSPNATTVYTVNATTSDFCFASNTTTVTVNPSPIVQATSAKAEICRGESVDLTAAGATTYSWNTGGSGTSISVSPNVNTTYTVTGINSNGCAATGTVFVKVNLCLGVGETSNISLTGISVFPNPSSGDFTVNSKVEISLTLTNQLGQVVKVLELNQANNYQAKVEHLSQGVYFLTGKKDGQELNQKIIVNQ